MRKKTLAIYSLALAVVAGSSLALAEEDRGGRGKGPHGSPEERLQRMQQHLDLSDEQVSQIQAIHAGEGSRREKREAVRNVLNDEQRAKIEEHRAMRRQQGGGPRGQGPQESGESYN